MSLEHSPARSGVRVLRRRQVLERLGISSTTLWQWVKDGKFPAPFDLGPGTSAWLEDTVDDHLRTLAEHRDATETSPPPRRRLRTEGAR